jgi:hypothetical protein
MIGVGVEDVQALPVGDLGGEAAVSSTGRPGRCRAGLADPLVLLTEAGGHVDHAGAVVGVT